MCVTGNDSVEVVQVMDNLPGGGAQGRNQRLQEAADENKGILSSDSEVESGQDNDAVDQ